VVELGRPDSEAVGTIWSPDSEYEALPTGDETLTNRYANGARWRLP
jgi:hypothetical protein